MKLWINSASDNEHMFKRQAEHMFKRQAEHMFKRQRVRWNVTSDKYGRTWGNFKNKTKCLKKSGYVHNNVRKLNLENLKRQTSAKTASCYIKRTKT